MNKYIYIYIYISNEWRLVEQKFLSIVSPTSKSW